MLNANVNANVLHFLYIFALLNYGANMVQILGFWPLFVLGAL